MDICRLLVITFAATSATFVLSLLVAKARPDKHGWRHLKPGAMHWVGVGLGSALIGLFSYIRLFVGSTRHDAATQMTILTGLIIAFGLMTIATALGIHQIRRRAIYYRGETICFNGSGDEEKRQISDVQHIGRNLLGHVVLTFGDGAKLRIDAYATGARELIARITKEDNHA